MPPLEPEQLARQKIDDLLRQAGWVIQDREHFDRFSAMGIAVEEFLVEGKQEADYLLFVDGKAAGIIEAKKAGETLSGVEAQSGGYAGALPAHVKAHMTPLPFVYESNGEEVYFRDGRDPNPRSRRVFAFHKPETLQRWLQEGDTLRARLRGMPELEKNTLRDCQFDAIRDLEASLAKGGPRSLIQMATGAGKTYTACNFSYRLLKHGRAKRILFLVDRNNLGRQTLREYQNFQPADAINKFTQTYNTQHLTKNQIDPSASVVITTIQRLYSMLRGEADFTEDSEEISSFEMDAAANEGAMDVVYNPAIPIEAFDVIVTDECHRSIYGLWRQVLEYFDAFIIGLTATPSMHTLGYFNRNIVSEYTYENSVADGVNVGFEVFRIRTRVTDQGSTVEAGYSVAVRDKRTRKIKYEKLDETLTYAANELDRSVTSPNQIRTVLECYKNALFTELYPERGKERPEDNWVPKTLIFAKDDNHAEEIVRIAREVFGKSNEFCKKITYNVTGETPEELIKAFRMEPLPRMAVTVDMIATGTDIKSLEVVIFMRDVRSELYYEQMKGRGARTIQKSDLQLVTPNAECKSKFILIDAVGVTESHKTISQPLERKRNIGFKTLIEQIAQGRDDDDSLSSLAARLAAMQRNLEPEDLDRITEVSGGLTLVDLTHRLIDATDPDKIEAEAATRFAPPVDDEKRTKAEEALKETAIRPYSNATLRQLLIDLKVKSRIVIDEITVDEITYAGYDIRKAEELTKRFEAFIEANKDTIDALSIIYNQAYKDRKLTYEMIERLHEAMTYTDYVMQFTYLLFLKMDEEREELAGEGSQVPAKYRWKKLKNMTGDDLVKHYRETLEALSTGKGLLRTIYSKAQNKINEPARLQRLIQLIDEETWLGLDMDIKGAIYEGLLARNAEESKAGAGQYFTPRPLIRAMVDVMRPQPTMTVCDPACGTGGFLLAAYEHMVEQTNDKKVIQKLRDEKLHGSDITEQVAALCAMNMYLHGISGAIIESGKDALLMDDGKRYDMVLANPPFGKKSSYTVIGEDGRATQERENYERDDFKVTTSNKQLNFLQHIMTILEVGGSAAVVLPDNVLFEAGAGEKIRKRLLSDFDLHTILRLPTGIFYKQGVKANVLFFDKKPASEKAWTKETWVYDFRTNMHFTLVEKPLQRDDLNEFVAAYNPEARAKRKESERFKRFTYDELASRDKLNLDIFWLKDDSLEDVDNLPAPDIIAAEIVDNLEAALEQFRGVAEALRGDRD